MKKLIPIFAISTLSAFSYGQCTQNAGIDYYLGSTSSHTPNYLLGSAITLTSSFNLIELGFLSINSGQNFKVAVYDDAAGNPGNLLTQGSGTVVAGTNIVDVPDAVLPAGTYYFMAVFESVASLSYTGASTAGVWYISHTFANPLPASFGAPLFYTGQDFSYYFIGSTSTVTATDTQTACNSLTWIDGNTYTSDNNTATFNIVGGSVGGCDSIVTLDLTIINSSTGTDVQTACNTFTWIDGNTYTSDNNTATFNIIGGAANGCDSLVTLDLTINNVSDLTTTTVGTIIIANNTAATYQWLDCDNAYAMLAGETGSTYTATVSGNYAVQLSENGCVDTTACINMDFSGLSDEVFGSQFDVYPNPTDGNFFINLGENFQSVKISVTDLTGRIIQSSEFSNANILNINITEPAGIYFLVIQSDENTAVVRLVKQ
ncbi:MAG: T9SS type A sorting domain-containing protein [Crocinitomicaceae bacterium]|nr:T9SS type A sorting domain-containing protein [Crocinitomicaceae bacterium]MBK8925287.1 T9SS type A sorting domain-containing protein [Crocinitomicaceae bacterium]